MTKAIRQHPFIVVASSNAAAYGVDLLSMPVEEIKIITTILSFVVVALTLLIKGYELHEKIQSHRRTKLKLSTAVNIELEKPCDPDEPCDERPAR